MTIRTHLFEVLVTLEGPHANPQPLGAAWAVDEAEAVRLVQRDRFCNPDALPANRMVARLAEYSQTSLPEGVRVADQPPRDWLARGTEDADRKADPGPAGNPERHV